MSAQAELNVELNNAPEVYQGQFGEFEVTAGDRQGVVIYRAGLMVAALSFAAAASLTLWPDGMPMPWLTLTILYATFSLGLAVSLFTIHIYLAALHRALQAFLGIGTIAAIACAFLYPEPLAIAVYSHPVSILGIGFTFAALTGIFFKEAFCFNRFETKLLTPLVPMLLLGHWIGILPLITEQIMLAAWAVLFMVFAVRKVIQPIPPDIGDKSVFEHLRQAAVQA